MKSNVIAIAKKIKGTSYVSINNYLNSSSELSNYLIVAGYSHENALKHDLEQLSNFNYLELNSEHSIAVIKQAYDELLSSLLKRVASEGIKEILRQSKDATILKSDAQKEAFIHLAPGIKRHKETKELFVHGLVVRKTVIQKGIYKSVNSSEKTIVKNKIKALCNFRETKIREFKVTNGTIKIKGQTI